MDSGLMAISFDSHREKKKPKNKQKKKIGVAV